MSLILPSFAASASGSFLRCNPSASLLSPSSSASIWAVKHYCFLLGPLVEQGASLLDCNLFMDLTPDLPTLLESISLLSLRSCFLAHLPAAVVPIRHPKP